MHSLPLHQHSVSSIVDKNSALLHLWWSYETEKAIIADST